MAARMAVLAAEESAKAADEAATAAAEAWEAAASVGDAVRAVLRCTEANDSANSSEPGFALGPEFQACLREF